MYLQHLLLLTEIRGPTISFFFIETVWPALKKQNLILGPWICLCFQLSRDFNRSRNEMEWTRFKASICFVSTRTRTFLWLFRLLVKKKNMVRTGRLWYYCFVCYDKCFWSTHAGHYKTVTTISIHTGGSIPECLIEITSSWTALNI